MKLYCVRHGEAEDAAVNPERPLTESGKEGIEKVARYVGEAGVHIDYLMHSPKVRAVETAEIFSKFVEVGRPNECTELLDELHDVTPIIDMIPAWDSDTMLVGHLPFMNQLISTLVLNQPGFYPIVNYPPGTIICLERYEKERWIISWLLNPPIVPSLNF